MREQIHRKVRACSLVLLIVLAVGAFGQGPSSAPAPTYNVKAIVTDATGAVIAMSDVVFKSESKTITKQTGADGSVHLRLASGHYVVMVSCRGFKTTKVVDFAVQPDTPAVLNIILDPGKVEVTIGDGAAPLVSTPISDLPSQVIEHSAAPEYCSQVEPLRPNLMLRDDTVVRGHVSDQTTAAFQHSPIELRHFISETKQETVGKVSTDGAGNFDLGMVKQGDYRLLLSPNRGFKQPERLECSSNPCTLNAVLIGNPTDEPASGCPIR